METTTVNQRVGEIVYDHLKLKNTGLFDKLLGVAKNTTYNIINGRGSVISKPSTDYLQKVCEACPDIDANWLLLGVGSRVKPDFKKLDNITIDYNNLTNDYQRLNQENQSLKFALSLAANSANFQPRNFSFVGKKTPVKRQDIVFFKSVAHSFAHTGS